ncbi:MAG: phage portal protein, partial [Bacteroidia bacterium]|nr:phage portal protein [Bacteroidia bacterium]
MNVIEKIKGVFQRENTPTPAQTWLVNGADFDCLCSQGYTSLDHCPEVLTACRRIADMISSMTIYLMANTQKGDSRIVNELSRKVDIFPSQYMTRKTWMDFIVMTLLLYGKGNAVVFPHTQDGYLGDLEPIPKSRFGFLSVNNGRGYRITIDGKEYDPDDVLHFVLNPCKYEPWRGEGLTIALGDLANNLKQAADTEKGFMASKWKPSLIIKVDALVDEFATPEGRSKLLEEYVNTSRAGEPWLIPAEQFAVQEVRPLSLSDLAISDVVTLDKKTVATILGVPPFVLGVGEYNKDEWNAFISNTIRPIARGIEQELTRKLLISPKMYWKFNMASLYSYDLKTTEEVYSELYVRGIVTG